MKKLLPVLAIMIAGMQPLYAQVKEVKLVTKSPQIFRKTEFDIRLIETWNNPYLQEEIAVDMLLTSPSGKKLVLPCYYESGESGSSSLWKARFAPQEKGKYSYVFRVSKNGKVTSTSKDASFQAGNSSGKGFLKVKDNWVLQFDNGEAFRGLGENLCWESRANDDSKYFKALHEQPKYNYEYMLPSLAKHGGNFFRTWICSFNLPLDWKKGFNSNRYTPTDKYFNPGAIVKIDRMFDLSDSLGLYVMLTLGMGAYHVNEGGFSPSAEDFFVNPLSKQRYKNRLRYFIARWGYSTSVGMWELFNEVDNVQFRNKEKPISAASIVQWHDEMSAYIKETDPYQHIVTTSISHRDLEGLNSLKHIDINQKHIYKNTAAIPATVVQYEQQFDKPYVIGEFGYEWDWSKNFDDFADGMDSDFKRGLWYGLFSPTPVLPLSWWWEYFDNRGTDAYIQHVRTIQDQMLSAGKGDFKPLNAVVSDTAIIKYGVKCGNVAFVYLHNPGNSEKKIDLELDVVSKEKESKMYWCESGKSSMINVLAGKGKVKWSGVHLKGGEDIVLILGK
ncbi:MAG: glycoside hydrolase [Citrobacter freundii]|nr:MAG: glycoside hydrolase [Citrobacter freundii]